MFNRDLLTVIILALFTSLVPEGVRCTLTSHDAIPAAQQPLTARLVGFVLNIFGFLSVILTASPTEHLQIGQFLLYLKSPHGYLAMPKLQIFCSLSANTDWCWLNCLNIYQQFGFLLGQVLQQQHKDAQVGYQQPSSFVMFPAICLLYGTVWILMSLPGSSSFQDNWLILEFIALWQSEKNPLGFSSLKMEWKSLVSV